MIFAGKELTEQDIAQAYKAVFSQYYGQIVACDILLKCGFFDEVTPDSMSAAFYLRNFANWFLKRLGIIREDNLINMVRNFMGQDVPVVINPEKEKKE